MHIYRIVPPKVCFSFVFCFIFFASQSGLSEPGLSQTEVLGVKGYEKVKNVITSGSKARVIVRLKRDKTVKATNGKSASSKLNKFSTEAKARGIKEFAKIPRFNLAVYEVDQSELESLLASGEVEAVYEDKLVQPLLQYSVPFIRGDRVHMEDVQGAGQAVAILDSGVDLSHPAFNGRVVAEACFSNADNINSFSLCPNGQPQQTGSGAGDDCYKVFQQGDCTHGTHVAGISAGFDSEITGVAPAADIISVQVFHRYSSDSRIYASSSDMILALQWVLENAQTYNIAAVNMSIGGGVYTEYCDDEPIKEVIDALRTVGVATVIAAGNNAQVGATYPGCVSTAVTVAATYRDVDLFAGYSNLSPMVDVAAPGSSIYAPIPGNSYDYKSGTSMATPHVTGAFALLRSAVPDLSVNEIEQVLKATGISIMDSNSGAVIPRIDLFAAYQTLVNNTVDGVAVTVDINNDWGSGYCAGITLENMGNKALTWNVLINIAGTISSLWNGNWIQNGSAVNLSGVGWNSTLQPGQIDTSLGFCASR